MSIVKQYLNAWNNHDPDAIKACFLFDGIYIDSNINTEISAELLAQRAAELFRSFPDLKITIEDQTSGSSGLIATRWTIWNAFPDKGLSGVDMICIANGKIQSIQVYFDRDTGRLFTKVPSLHLKYQLTELSKNSYENQIKYRTSGLTEQESQKIIRQLRALMTDHQKYLDHDLSLSTLSSELDISTNHLSQVINSQCQCNYFDYINRFRIEHALRLINTENKAGAKSLVIALDSGFKSTSTFYSSFKKYMGMTPKEYKTQQIKTPVL